jgi:hypothetical protein
MSARSPLRAVWADFAESPVAVVAPVPRPAGAGQAACHFPLVPG